MMASGTYGTFLEILAFTKVCQRSVTIYQFVNNEYHELQKILGPDSSRGDPICLLYEPQVRHYQLLLPARSEDKMPKRPIVHLRQQAKSADNSVQECSINSPAQGKCASLNNTIQETFLLKKPGQGKPLLETNAHLGNATALGTVASKNPGKRKSLLKINAQETPFVPIGSEQGQAAMENPAASSLKTNVQEKPLLSVISEQRHSTGNI